MRKTAVALAHVSILFFSMVAGTQVAKAATMNENPFPEPAFGFTPPTLSLESPNSRAIYINGVPINFTLNDGGFEPGGPLSGVIIGGGSSYSLDGQTNVTITGNTILTGLSKGTHQIEVYASYYVGWGQVSGPFSVTPATVIFTVIPSTPTISVIVPENRTYNVTSLQLVFSVNEMPQGITNSQMSLAFNANETPSWLAYSLDGQTNKTIAGNTTLTQLYEGSHAIAVYANNTNGKMGASKTIYFSVIREPEPAPFPTVLLIVAVSSTVVVTVAAGVLVYWKKRKR